MVKKKRQLSLWAFPRYLKPRRMKTGDGGELRLYQLPALTLLTGKTAETLIRYEKSGVLPKTPYRKEGEGRDIRYYTFDQMRVVRETFHDIGKKNIFKQDGYEAIHQRILIGWAINGVPAEPGLDMLSALRLSVGSSDGEAVEQEFLLRALEKKKGNENGKAESGSVDGWLYLQDESSQASYKKKSRRFLAQQFNAICSGSAEGVSKGFAGVAGRDNGKDDGARDDTGDSPLYTESGSRLWRRPRPRGVCGDSVDK